MIISIEVLRKNLINSEIMGNVYSYHNWLRIT